MWLILEIPELCSKLSYACSQFFVGSAVLRNETVITANKGAAVASLPLGILEAPITYLSVIGLLGICSSAISSAKPCRA
jgi:hypothetical protein